MSHNLSEIETPLGTVPHLHLEVVESTNSYAMKMLRNNKSDFNGEKGFLVTAKDQTSGRGQRDKYWSSSPGQDLTMSWVVKEPPKVEATLFNMAASLATANGIKDVADVQVKVKWPNDVMVWSNGSYRKVSGILVENSWRGGTWTASVVGIGINVGSRRLSRSYNAISISEVLSKEFNPNRFIKPIINQLLSYIKILSGKNGGELVAREFNRELLGKDECRTFQVAGNEHQGVLKEISFDGMGVFEWKKEGEHSSPNTRLHSSEVTWVFSNHPH